VLGIYFLCLSYKYWISVFRTENNHKKKEYYILQNYVYMAHRIIYNCVLRGDQEGLFKLVTLDRILNRITGVNSGCWWLVVVNAIPILDICQINQQNISSCSVINNRIKKFL
jgi:hypothetical protein